MIDNYFASIDASDLAEHLQEQQNIEIAQLEHMREWEAGLASMDRKTRYRAKNKALLRHKQAMRRAAMLNAVPPWLTQEQEQKILRLHEKAVEKEFWSKVPHDVHHSIPLCGKCNETNSTTVCGLHVPWNLEVIERKENLSIGAKFDSMGGFTSNLEHGDDGNSIPF